MTYDSLYRNSRLIRRISIERIREETNKILLSGCPGRGIKLLYDTGLLISAIFTGIIKVGRIWPERFCYD
ncbi:MAG: hypothetical protein ACYDEJ_02900 [Desulfitobacteriaceae bacterium]